MSRSREPEPRAPAPLMVAMSGLVASGKSTVARAIAAELEASVVDTSKPLRENMKSLRRRLAAVAAGRRERR